MFRKLALGLVAAGALGIAAFSPTSASAYDNGPRLGRHQDFGTHRGWHDTHRGWHDTHRGWHGPHRGWHGAHAHFRHHGCLQQRLVPTPWGPRYRTVNVCRF